jgi:bifunctional DNA-binding transcriptional regulator/antitoxin component of YhaV-PrlF toxin-antitoxin module
LSGSDKLVSDCFFEAKLKSVATVIAINRKSSQIIAFHRKPSYSIANNRERGGKRMLDKRINFKNVYRNGRILVPKLYRWQYKIEGSQVLKVGMNLAGDWSNNESFLTKIRKDGYIAIPKAVQSRLKRKDLNLEGRSMDVTLEPA